VPILRLDPAGAALADTNKENAINPRDGSMNQALKRNLSEL
jgi:hypothetical protein